MRRVSPWIRMVLALAFLVALGAPAPAQEDDAPALHDCGDRICGEWKQKSDEKGDRTCRSCETAQCKTIDGKDALAGTKKQTECYEGHGPPPEDD